jgi:1,4-alpha-glucan branching enzyme
MKTKHERQQSRSTRFACHAPEAKAVFLTGTFNDWKTDATPMTKNGQGNWSVTLDLPQGIHEFKFVVDGIWCCEPGREEGLDGGTGRVPNPFGTMNRVIEVP